jgi:PadR family transcriptional regulator PadR
MKELTRLEEHILLSVFHLKENAYLITVRDFIKEKTGKELSIGTIYVPLERLRRKGHVSTRIVKPAPKVGGRSVKYYGLTKEGFASLENMKKVHDRMWWGFSEARTK